MRKSYCLVLFFVLCFTTFSSTTRLSREDSNARSSLSSEHSIQKRSPKIRWMIDPENCAHNDKETITYIGFHESVVIKAWHQTHQRTALMGSCRTIIHNANDTSSLGYNFEGDNNYIRDCNISLNVYTSSTATKPLKSYSCNSSFDHEHTVLPGDVDSCTLVIELINPDNSTDYDFTLHIRDETHFPPTKAPPFHKVYTPAIVGTAVAAAIVLAAVAVVVVMKWTKRGIKVPSSGGGVAYNQLHEEVSTDYA